MSSDHCKTPPPSSLRDRWRPFATRPYAILWVATVASNIGTWMHDVGAGWLMTELAPSPMMVAMVQAATTLPIFLFALLAGAVADIVDRRKLLIWVNLVLGVLPRVGNGGSRTSWPDDTLAACWSCDLCHSGPGPRSWRQPGKRSCRS